MEATTVKVIKNNTLLLGKTRKYGDYIPAEEFEKLSLHVRNALQSSGVVKIIGGDLTNKELHGMIQELTIKIDSLEKRIDKLTSGDNDIVQVDVTEPDDTGAVTRKARKGDNVQFEEIDDDGNIYIVDAEVLKVSQGIATVVNASGKEQNVEVDNLTVVA